MARRREAARRNVARSGNRSPPPFPIAPRSTLQPPPVRELPKHENKAPPESGVRRVASARRAVVVSVARSVSREQRRAAHLDASLVRGIMSRLEALRQWGVVSRDELELLACETSPEGFLAWLRRRDIAKPRGLVERFARLDELELFRPRGEPRIELRVAWPLLAKELRRYGNYTAYGARRDDVKMMTATAQQAVAA